MSVHASDTGAVPVAIAWFTNRCWAGVYGPTMLFEQLDGADDVQDGDHADTMYK